MYPLPCPACQQILTVTNSQAGTTTTCSHCRAAVAVPKLGDLRRLVEAGEPNGSVSSGSGDGLEFRRAAFAALMALAGIAGLGGGFCAIRYWNVEVPASTALHIEEVQTAFKQVPASQLVREYQQMEKYGLELGQPFTYKRLEVEKAGWLKNTLIAFGISGALAVVATVLGSAGRKRQPAAS